jgi:hypothetical protein
LRGGPYHSQSVEAYYTHVPGLKVVAPSFPADAKGLLAASVLDPNPVLFLEHKAIYRSVMGVVPEGYYLDELGTARRVRGGDSITVLAWGAMLHESLAAAEMLAATGIECDVIDLRTLAPVDKAAIIESVRATRALCVVHEDTRTMGFGAELVAMVSEWCLDDLRYPPLRITTPDVGGIPVADSLEDAVLPRRELIASEVSRSMSRMPRSSQGSRFDAAIPVATSVVSVRMPEAHLERVLAAIEEACEAFPECNAEFTWAGIRYHPTVKIDLDLGSRSPGSTSGTVTVSDYGADATVLGLPAVRRGQTAAFRIGAVRSGSALLALSVDHRAVDGGAAGRFLELVKTKVEQ